MFYLNFSGKLHSYSHRQNCRNSAKDSILISLKFHDLFSFQSLKQRYMCVNTHAIITIADIFVRNHNLKNVLTFLITADKLNIFAEFIMDFFFK